MGQFKSKLEVELVDQQAASGRGKWKLVKPLVFQSDIAGQTITVPAGFITDFASVPRFPSFIFSVFGDIAAEATTVHDYLYDMTPKILGRKMSDEILREAALASGTPHWKAMGLYLGVRIAGWKFFKE